MSIADYTKWSEVWTETAVRDYGIYPPDGIPELVCSLPFVSPLIAVKIELQTQAPKGVIGFINQRLKLATTQNNLVLSNYVKSYPLRIGYNLIGISLNSYSIDYYLSLTVYPWVNQVTVTVYAYYP